MYSFIDVARAPVKRSEPAPAAAEPAPPPSAPEPTKAASTAVDEVPVPAAEPAPAAKEGGESGNESDFNSMTVKELTSLCKEKGISGYSKLRKADLIDLVASYGTQRTRNV